MVSGRCLCGSVRFEIRGVCTPIQFCHCPRCRKASGGPFVAAVAALAEWVHWLAGEELITSYAAPILQAPPPYRTAFCSRCGSPLPIVTPERQFAVIPAGCLDDDPGSRGFRHIFVGIKAPWFEITDDLPQFERHVPPQQRLP